MRTQTTARLGDLIAAVFDEAGRYSKDPIRISRLATDAIRRLTHRERRIFVPPWTKQKTN